MAAISSIVTCVVQAETPEILLWPDGVSEPAVPSEPVETSITDKDGLTRRYNVSNPRLFVHVPEMPAAAARAAVVWSRAADSQSWPMNMKGAMPANG